jgi:hypothetical protein
VESHVSALTADERSNYQSMLSMFDDEIVDNIPRIPTKGYVKFRGAAKKA